ncbi:MAG: hypothetical protein PVJ86_02805 [Phycisphaerales bacterium]|jgi:hypothetical protein
MLTIWRALKGWLIELFAEIKEAAAPVSFGITDENGAIFFVRAHRFTIDDDGRLLFWMIGSHLKAAVDADKWQRVLEGITLEDFKEE